MRLLSAPEEEVLSGVEVSSLSPQGHITRTQKASPV